MPRPPRRAVLARAVLAPCAAQPLAGATDGRALAPPGAGASSHPLLTFSPGWGVIRSGRITPTVHPRGDLLRDLFNTPPAVSLTHSPPLLQTRKHTYVLLTRCLFSLTQAGISTGCSRRTSTPRARPPIDRQREIVGYYALHDSHASLHTSAMLGPSQSSLSVYPLSAGHRACAARGRRDRAHGAAAAAAAAIGGARAAAWRVHIPVGPLPGLRRRAAGAEVLRDGGARASCHASSVCVYFYRGCARCSLL